MTLRQVAMEIERPASTIYYAAKKVGIKNLPRGRAARELTLKEISSLLEYLRRDEK